jgi:integrase
MKPQELRGLGSELRIVTMRNAKTVLGAERRGIVTIKDFVETDYLPHCVSTLSPSTCDGYDKLWKGYGEYLGTNMELRVCECQAILREICAKNPHLRKTTVQHLKNFFSGVWAHALRMGAVSGGNPWRDVSLPSAPEPSETYAYSAKEIEVMIKMLEQPYDLLVLLAASTGLRKSEIRGLRWEDWDSASSTLSVRRAVWRKHVKNTKNVSSKAPVPVVANLAQRLDTFREKAAAKRYIFESDSGSPLDLDNVARRIIVPALRETDVRWHGWHGMRRGLATILHSRGVPDKEIQTILRHGNISVTQKCYVRSVPENVRAAMSSVSFAAK